MSRDQISEVKVSPVMNGEEEFDDLLWQSQSPVSLRFASPLSSEELFSKVEESVPENTHANTKWVLCHNHSLRRSCASRLFQEGAEEQVIMSVTGHRSVDGMRSYKMISDKQLQATYTTVEKAKD